MSSNARAVFTTPTHRLINSSGFPAPRTTLENVGRISWNGFCKVIRVFTLLRSSVLERNTLRPFPAAVTLVMSDTGGYRRVNTAQDATETLLDHWPIRDGEAYLTAIQACLDAIMERVHPQAARNAFIKAAEEAGVSLLQ